jgi:hypothetical protein
MAPMLFALDEVVEADPNYPSDDLEKTELAAVPCFSEVGGDRFGALAGRTSSTVEPLPQRRGKAFLGFVPPHLAGEGFASHDRSEHAAFRMSLLEREDFLIGPAGLCGFRGTEDDQAA